VIVERHYDDETLIALLGSREAVRDPHLASCSTCADALTSYRAIADVLTEEPVWELSDLRLEPQPETLDLLRRSADTKQAEAQRAGNLVAELILLPREQWLAGAQHNADLHNLGVVERLIEASEEVLPNAPPDGLEMARVAMEIATIIQPGQYRPDAVIKARAAARRQYAYSLFYTGDFANALARVDEAEHMLDACAIADHDRARLGIVRTVISSAQERHDVALQSARASAEVFRAYGDRTRLASALFAEAYALMSQLRFTESLPLLLDIEQRYREDIDADTRARVLGNIAWCQWETGLITDSLRTYQIVTAIYDELGIHAESARIRYQIAFLLASAGRTREAEARLRSVREEFSRLEMTHNAVLAGLDLAELLLLDGKFDEVEFLARQALQQFQAAGVEYTANALTALTFIQEAAKDRRVTAEAVRSVKRHIERLPEEPRLQFAPPPLPPG
jgi:tetratricopeptide (TPR) repeat protein